VPIVIRLYDERISPSTLSGEAPGLAAGPASDSAEVWSVAVDDRSRGDREESEATGTTANTDDSRGNEDERELAKPPPQLAIIDTFEAFTPKIIDVEQKRTEVLVRPTEPLKLVEPERPTVDVATRAEPPKVEFFQAEAKATTVGFAVDCSSSMQGEKFRAVCNELASSILRLKADQKFFVVFFNDQCFPMTGAASAPELVAATRHHKEAILRFLSSATAQGGTNPEPAIRFLASLKPDVIYLLTDGEFAPLSNASYGLLSASKVAVHSIGFEAGGRVATLEEIAQRTSGTYRSVNLASASRTALYLAPPQAVEAALAHADPDVRCEAIQAAVFRSLPFMDQVIPLLADQAVQSTAHDALCSIAETSDFGPCDPNDVPDAVRRWSQWWKLRAAKNPRKRILDALRSSNRDDVWVAASVARITRLDEPDALIAALRTASPPVWQEIHGALLRCCPDAGDLGPSNADATREQVAAAADRWASWRAVEREKQEKAVFEARCKRASSLLRLARYFIDTKPDVAVFERRCKEIIRDFGDTPAAEEARRLLDSVNGSDSGN